jgi:hypothetical protein
LPDLDLKSMCNILLTFDVEEFDLPLEYGITISNDEWKKV